MPPRPPLKQMLPILLLGLAAILIIAGLFWFGGYIGTKRGAKASPTPSGKPQVAGASTAPQSATVTPVRNGLLNGKANFPGGSTLPAMLIYAVRADTLSVVRSSDYSAHTTPEFSLNVPPGDYYVFAHLKTSVNGISPDYKAFYNEFAICQKSGGTCMPEMHTQYRKMHVDAGQTTGGIDVFDWSAVGQ